MKKLFSLLLVFLFSVTLVACNGDDEGKGKITITFWHTTPMGDPGYAEISKLVKEFNESQDEIYVKHVGYSFWDYWDKLDIVVAGGKAPDIGLNTLDDAKSRAMAGQIYNLQPLIERDNFDTSVFYDNQLEFGTYNGDLYAFPFTATTRVLYYNLDLFEAAGLSEEDVPTTWSELYEVAKKLDQYDEKGNLVVLGFDPTTQEATYHGWLWTAGLDFFDDNNNPILDSDAHVAVLEWMRDFNKDIPKDKLDGFTAANQLLGLDPFTAGRTAMYIANDSLHYTLQRNQVQFRYGVSYIPVHDENGVRVNWGSGFSLEMFNNKDEKKKEAAWTFYKYLLSKEVQLTYYHVTGWLMANKEAMEEPAKNDPILARLVEELQYARDKRFVEYAPAWHANDFQPFLDRALERNSDVKKILKEANDYYIQKRENYEATR